ncbi:MAG: 50S ribosomal protein L18 [Cycloclasticus sp.]|nr:50S ribosomal protein L18 [Cycloclasticus sp.]
MAQKYKRRKKVVRGNAERLRVLIYRSNKTVYGQLIDDINGKTLMSLSGLSSDIKDEVSKTESKVEASALIGKRFAEKAKTLDASKVIFDRNGYLYHGRVKAFAEGAREGGLEF